VEKAFSAGFDPALELYKAGRDTQHRRLVQREEDFLLNDSSDLQRPLGHVIVHDDGGDKEQADNERPFVNTASNVKNLDKPLKEQAVIDIILRGDAPEHYFMMLGPKVPLFLSR